MFTGVSRTGRGRPGAAEGFHERITGVETVPKVELSREEVTMLTDALRVIAAERAPGDSGTVRAVDAQLLIEKLEFARGPFLSPVA